MSVPRLGGAGAAAILLLVLADVALVARGPLPVSEARYLSVAWEMWQRGDWLVPHLNGQPYPDKPPLMFWTILLGWSLGGVGETWARLVAPLFGVGCLALTDLLARDLWPESPGIRRMAPLMLVSLPVFLVFATIAFFDVPLGFFVLLALWGAVRAVRAPVPGIIAMGVGLGLGALTKGPVVLLHVLPVVLLAPLWSRRVRSSWRRWYAGVAVALVLGAAIGLGWAIPAARAGGETYGAAILWGQTGGRLAASFAHAEPWWWYLPWLPLLAYPWLWWPPLWRAAVEARHTLAADAAIRFCLVWFAVPFVGFCLISGKQPNYLVPLLPALTLLTARLLADAPPPRRWDASLPLAPLGLAAALGLAMTIGAIDWLPSGVAGVAAEVSPFGPSVLAFGLAGLFALRWRTREQGVLQLTGAVAVAYLAVHVGFATDVRHRFDLAPAARFLADAQGRGLAVAHPLGYEGLFQFVGRLVRPLDEVEEPALDAWAAAHPGGLIVSYPRRTEALPEAPTFLQPYRGRWVAVWPAEAVARHGYAALDPE
ncbi:MAG: glycosyltransferase family 39 protein [Alphaproteobacteria bacterium]